ncbi:MAG: glycosyltransferase [Candidatus Bathyarchaeia archaeon]
MIVYNLTDLIDLENIIKAYFLIGGDGSLLTKLENLAEKKNLRTIRFLIEVGDAVEFHQVCDVFVLASTREGLSTSLQEAMSRGAVPVAVGGYGCPELIKNS